MSDLGLSLRAAVRVTMPLCQVDHVEMPLILTYNRIASYTVYISNAAGFDLAITV